MASTSRAGAAQKRRVFRGSSASRGDFSDQSSSSESEDDPHSSDLSTDDGDSSDQPTSSSRYASAVCAVRFLCVYNQLWGMEHVLTSIYLICRVSTLYGNDSLPAAVKRVEFLPRPDPGIDLGMALRSSAKSFV